MVTKRIINEYHKQIYAHKFDKPDEMDQLFKRHSVPNFTQEETDHLNKPKSLQEMNSIVSYFPKHSLKPKWAHLEFYQTFKEEIMSILYNLF